MHSVRIVIFFWLSGALKNINKVSSENNDSLPVKINIQKPANLSDEDYVKQTTDFWTDERLNAAIPVPIIEKNPLPTVENSTDTITFNKNERPTLVQGTLPASSIMSRRAGYPNTVGKVYFVDRSSLYSCSASVVTADNKDLIFTAGHCIYSTTNYAFVTNFIFIPQYHNNTRPYGTWVARSLYAISSWTSYLDLNYDVAIVLLYTSSGQHIQDIVGSQAVGFNYGHSATVYSFGYPINYANTEIMTYCTNTKYFPSYSNYTGDAVSCTMNQGCSGGPWFQSFTFSSLSGIQTSVNSFIRTATPNVMYGPYFGSTVLSLYNRAKVDSGTTSSAAPHYIFSGIYLLLFGLLQKFFQSLYLN
ncbi:unnamed protein product [Rotaria socialis]|uniref:Peptidase S1 domain-containing protein n=1 Tax=Rotaria socialis TaxID=392032 RepID=A0A817V903_9BILA|nr:unnamed protein product [Rotaria socialis]CAF3474642.1 unnamed protein product [Rotaria socialis]CAF3563681.1 unnamed protein product [Rotaria socialis]CAF4462088.1 unnamed protein product [Rotaria socialis]CAF4514387.1 unnamed protein product [Rotaria socialis]